MTRQGCNLLHRWVFPDNNLIQRITMRTNKLIAILRKGQIANLTPRINTINPLPRQTIPKANTPIRRSPSARQQPMLMRTPSDRLDRRRMIRKRVKRLSVLLHIPHQQLVIVPARREHGTLVERPLQPAHLLLVPAQPHLVRRIRPRIAEVDEPIARSRREEGGMSGGRSARAPASRELPGERADAGRVSRHGAHELRRGCVPELDVAAGAADGEVTSALAPRDGGDGVLGGTQIAELGDAGGGGAPEVDAASESDGEDVLGGPVDEVEVKVVLERRRVEDLCGHLGDLAFASFRVRSEGGALVGSHGDGGESEGVDDGGVPFPRSPVELPAVVVVGTEPQIIAPFSKRRDHTVPSSAISHASSGGIRTVHQPRGTLHRMHRRIDVLPQQLAPQQRIVQKGLAVGRVVTLRSSVRGGGVVREGGVDGRRATVGSRGGGVGSSSSGRAGGGGGRVGCRRASHHGGSEARSGRQRRATVRRAAVVGIGRG
mmetsp:Transcript_31408/g.59737  ORF Transcript_31408/g.59737 Transcript_31408/m.59737 type:complete len:488 (-) Transcript_31408:17-1480(-)